MRTVLIGASALVSFMHGKNDGQKWVGIATLIVITLLPASFAINPDIEVRDLNHDIQVIEKTLSQIDFSNLSEKETTQVTETQKQIVILKTLSEKSQLSTEDKVAFRSGILHVQDGFQIINTSKKISLIDVAHASGNNSADLSSIHQNIANLNKVTDYVPWWIILLVSIAIWSGTMIGWKRIVRTIWEKIGKHKMNYSQAASSAIITAGTIGLASSLGLPVSTTHVMSSSVAGTMVEEHGWRNGVDPHMIRHILLAWVLTMPTTIILAGSIFYILQMIFVK
jgi:phosphate/sulfate permease